MIDYELYTHYDHLRNPKRYGVRFDRASWGEHGNLLSTVVYQCKGQSVFNQCSFNTEDDRQKFLSWLTLKYE
jgi:hypothetical protein